MRTLIFLPRLDRRSRLSCLLLLTLLSAQAVAAQTITIDGPATGNVGELLTFTASATGCVPVAGGWTWFTDGGQIAGPAGGDQINVSWNSAGMKGLSALNFNCGGTQGQATVQIVDAGRISLTAASLDVDEDAVQVILAARREGGANGAVAVSFTTTDETATGGQDYQTSSGELSWANGETGDRIFSITLLDDLIFEGDETFLVSLHSPTGGAVLGAVRETRVRLIENDPPPGDEIRFSESQYSESENSAFAVVRVSRTTALSGQVSVDFATSDFTATAGQDYQSTNVTLTWPDGDTDDRIVQIPLIDDSLVEGEEIVDLELSNPSSGAYLGDLDFAELSIVDDDAAAGSLQFIDLELTALESVGSVFFEVSRSGGLNGAVTVDVAIDGGSADPQDASLLTSRLTWDDQDDGSRFVEVSITDDSLVEGPETLDLILLSPTGGAVLGTNRTASLLIEDDDEATASTLAFATARFRASESAGSVSVTVLRQGNISEAAAARVESRDVSAIADLDYVPISRLLEWTPGDGSGRVFNITLIDDTEVEGDETFQVVLRDLVGAELGSPGAAAIDVTDDDVGLSLLSLESTTGQVAEADGFVEIVVQREGDLSLEASVTLVPTALTATAEADFDATERTVSWAAGDGSGRIVMIPILDDSEVEGDETFQVALQQPVNGQIASPSISTITILDDDTAASGTISLSASQLQVAESDGQATLTLQRSGGSAGAASAVVELVAITATAGADYQVPSSLQLEWADGQAGERVLEIPLVDDDLAEPVETFAVRIRATSGALIGSVRVATVSIVDDDTSGGICPDDDQALCLDTERFAVLVEWQTPDGQSGSAQPVGLTTDSGYFYFFDDSNVELVIKVLDGCSTNDRYWVFATGLTNLGVQLQVTDRSTDETVVYENPVDREFEPILDIDAFATCSSGSVGSVLESAIGRALALPDAPHARSVSQSCPAGVGDGTLCLSDSRFEVRIAWQTASENGIGQPAELTADTGTFWFFDPDNVELVIKVLDGCAINDRFWVFAGGLTNLATELEVVDTTSGLSRVYRNQAGNAFAPILDIDAFDACGP